MYYGDFNLQRVNYYDGEFLTKAEFQTDQAYHIDAVLRHDRLLHVGGIVTGLEVTMDSTGKLIQVSTGAAVDSLGQEILLSGPPSPLVVDSSWQSTMIIEIQYYESQTTLANNLSQVIDNTRTTQNSLPYARKLGDNPPLPVTTSPPVYLATVTVNTQNFTASDISYSSTNGTRAYSGVNLADMSSSFIPLQSTQAVETAYAVSSGATGSGGDVQVALVTANQPFAVGDIVTLNGSGLSGVDGRWTVSATGLSGITPTIVLSGCKTNNPFTTGSVRRAWAQLGSSLYAQGALTTLGNATLGTYDTNSHNVKGTLAVTSSVTAATIAGSNVGIGTLSPAHKLDVTGDANVTSALSVGGAGSVALGFTAAIPSGSNVGIGTLSPGHKLDVVGDARISNGLTVASGGLTVSGGGLSVTGTTGVTGSLTVSSGVTVNSGGISVTGDSGVTGSLAVSSNLTVSNGSLTVTGGLATLNNGLTVNNGATVTGTLSANGQIYLGTSGYLHWTGTDGDDDAWILYLNNNGLRDTLQIKTGDDFEDDIEFYQNGGARLNIWNGCVGINNQAPAYSLDVNGTAHVTQSLNVGTTAFIGGLTTAHGGLAVTGTTSLAGALTVSTGGANITGLVTANNGLSVSGATSLSGSLLLNGQAVATYGGSPAFGNLTTSGVITPSVGTGGGIIWPRDPYGGGGDVAWINYHSRGGESLSLQIGIENDADDQLEFWQYGAIRQWFNGGSAYFSNMMFAQGGLVVGPNVSTYAPTILNGGLTVNNNATIYSFLTVQGSANITGSLTVNGQSITGSGNTNPSFSSLHCSGAITPSVGGGGTGIEWPHDVWGGSGDVAWIHYFSEGGENTKLQIGCNNDGDDDIELYQYGSPRLNVYNGCVGINNPYPQWALEVGVYGQTTWWLGGQGVDGRLNGSIVARGAVWSSTYGWLSDERLKKNIAPLGSVLDKVMALRPVSFNWKSDDSACTGFLAHEVEAVFPDLVFAMTPDVPMKASTKGKLGVTAEEDPHKGLNLGQLPVLAIAAIKEMKTGYDARIQALEDQVKALLAQASAK